MYYITDERCLDCKHCVIHEEPFLKESLFECEMCEEETENKEECYEKK